MNNLRRLLATLLAAVCLLSHALTVPLAAAGGGSESEAQPRKVVSVLYDNSMSMKMTSTEAEHRYEYARYAIQMLVGLLGPEDQLVINPMNDPTKLLGPPITDTSHRVEVTLTGDRDAELERVLNNTFFAKKPAGETPAGSIAYAIEELVDEGMERAEDRQGFEASDTQYWLIILTDGPFDEICADEAIAPYIEPYASLQTVYLAFGKEFDKTDERITTEKRALESLAKELPFTYYIAPTSDELLEKMELVANQMTGRYTLPSESYENTGTRVTIDLDKIKYTVNNVSVIGQNCGASLASATLNGKTLSVSQECVIRPDDPLGIQTGFSAVIQTDGYLTGGVLELNFTGKVDELAVLVEPALYLETLLEYQDDKGNWIEADVATVCGTCRPGDKVRVDYRVYDRATDEPVSTDMLESLFGKPTTKVTYAGKSCEVGDPISLVAGKNEINVQLSMLNGAYNLYDSFMCIIFDNPDDYRVVGDGPAAIKSDAPMGEVVFSVYDKTVNPDGSKLTAAQLASYEWSVKAYHKDTGEQATATGTAQSDGTVLVRFEPNDDLYGEYVVEMEVVSEYGIPAQGAYSLAYSPAEIDVLVVSGDDVTMSQHQLRLQDDPEGNGRPDYQKRSIVFCVVTGKDQQPIDLDGPLLNYRLTVDGKDITDQALEAGEITVHGNRLTFIPTETNFGTAALTLGAKAVALTVTGKEFHELEDTATATVNVSDTAYEVIALDTTPPKIDRFRLVESAATLRFRVLRDGDPIPEADIKAAYEAGEITVTDKGTLTKYFWLPCGRDYEIVMLDSNEWGIEVRVTRDIFRPLHTFLAMLISDGEKQIQLTYKTSTPETASVVFEKSPLWCYIWRVLVLLLIAFVSFFVWTIFSKTHCKNLPRGTFVSVTFADDGVNAGVRTRRVNDTFAKRWMWHFRRLIPAFLPNGLPLMADQEPVKSPSGRIRIGYKKGDRDIKARFTTAKVLKRMKREVRTDEYGKKFSDFIKKTKNPYRGRAVRPEIPSEAMRRQFVAWGDRFYGPKDEPKFDSTTCFGELDADGELLRIDFFIEEKR